MSYTHNGFLFADDGSLMLGGLGGVQPLGNSIFMLGDSIVQKGVSDANADGTGASFSPLLQSRAWYAHAAMLSEGRLMYEGQAATGGFTTQQVRDTHLAAAKAAKSKLIGVMAGRNDVVNGVPFTTTAANLRYMYEQLMNAGKMPVLFTLPAQLAFPTATAAQITAQDRINAYIRAFAADKQLICIDFEAVTKDPATNGQKAGLMVDASHPTPGAGARALGAEMFSKLAPYLPPYKPLFAQAATNPANGDTNLVKNPLFTVDTNVDGVPDNWTAAGGAASKAYSLVDPATTGNDALGKHFRVARTAGTGAAQAFGDAIAVTPGDVVQFAFRFKAVVEAGGAWGAVRLIGNSAGQDPTVTQTQFVAGINTWNGDVTTPGLFVQRGVIAAGINFIAPVISLSVGTGAANIDVSQVSIHNLTALGLVDSAGNLL